MFNQVWHLILAFSNGQGSRNSALVFFTDATMSHFKLEWLISKAKSRRISHHWWCSLDAEYRVLTTGKPYTSHFVLGFECWMLGLEARLWIHLCFLLSNNLFSGYFETSVMSISRKCKINGKLQLKCLTTKWLPFVNYSIYKNIFKISKTISRSLPSSPNATSELLLCSYF